MVKRVKLKSKSKYRNIGFIIVFLSTLLPVLKTSTDTFRAKVNAREIESYIANKVDESNSLYSEKYIAVIEIPDINLKQGLTRFDSKYNNIKYNIQRINNITPDSYNGNIILASHSGNSQVAYFNNLDKLSHDSLIYIYYNGIKYIYKLDYSCSVSKDESVTIIRNKDKFTITLITCSKNSQNTQIIYIGYLINKIDY